MTSDVYSHLHMYTLTDVWNTTGCAVYSLHACNGVHSYINKYNTVQVCALISNDNYIVLAAYIYIYIYILSALSTF